MSQDHANVTVSAMYVSRERYVCLTGEKLAGWNISRKKFCFFCPPPQSDSDLRLARSYFHKTRFKNDRPIYNDDAIVLT